MLAEITMRTSQSLPLKTNSILHSRFQNAEDPYTRLDIGPTTNPNPNLRPAVYHTQFILSHVTKMGLGLIRQGMSRLC